VFATHRGAILTNRGPAAQLAEFAEHHVHCLIAHEAAPLELMQPEAQLTSVELPPVSEHTAFCPDDLQLPLLVPVLTVYDLSPQLKSIDAYGVATTERPPNTKPIANTAAITPAATQFAAFFMTRPLFPSFRNNSKAWLKESAQQRRAPARPRPDLRAGP